VWSLFSEIILADCHWNESFGENLNFSLVGDENYYFGVVGSPTIKIPIFGNRPRMVKPNPNYGNFGWESKNFRVGVGLRRN
jgi:hypothetical protein